MQVNDYVIRLDPSKFWNLEVYGVSVKWSGGNKKK